MSRWFYLGLSIVSLWFPQHSSAEEWAVSASGYQAAGVALDGSNNCFFGCSPATLTKVSASGAVIWTRQLSGSGSDMVATAVAADAQGNSYLCGRFLGTISAGSTNISSSGWYNVFLAKFDSSGGLIFLRRIGTPGNVHPTALSVSTTGEIFITGDFGESITSESATFGTNVFTTTASGEFFVVKLNSGGDVVWAQRSVLSGSNRYAQGRAIVAATNGAVYVGGHFGPAGLFGTNVLTSFGRNDAFLAKYNVAGQLEWIRTGGGSDVDTTMAVTLNRSGGCYASGGFVGGANLFGSNLVSQAFSDVFTASLDSDGNLLWLRQVSASETCGISSDSEGNAYVLLRFPVHLGFENLNGGGAIQKYIEDGRESWPRELGVNCCVGYSLVGIAAITNDAVIIGNSGGGQFGFTNLIANIVAARVEAPHPKLRIARLPSEISISWPGWAHDFSFVSRSVTSSSNAWLLLTNFYEDSESLRSYRTDATNAGLLFKLRK